MPNPHTDRNKQKFLKEFATGEFCGNVSACAIKAGVNRTTVYLWKNEDKGFLDDYLNAEEIAADKLEEVMQGRATVGWHAKKVVIKSRAITAEEIEDDEQLEAGAIEYERVETTEHKVDNMLLCRLLEARRPQKFSRRHNVDMGENFNEAMATLSEIMQLAEESEDEHNGEPAPDQEGSGACAPDENVT